MSLNDAALAATIFARALRRRVYASGDSTGVLTALAVVCTDAAAQLVQAERARQDQALQDQQDSQR